MTKETMTKTTHALYATLLIQGKRLFAFADSVTSVSLFFWINLQALELGDALEDYKGKILTVISVSRTAMEKAELLVQRKKSAREPLVVFLKTARGTFQFQLCLDFPNQNDCILYAIKKFWGKLLRTIPLYPRLITKDSLSTILFS